MINKYLPVWFRIKNSHPFVLFIVIVLFVAGTINLPAQSTWMQKGGSTGDDEGYSISTDNNNNTYTTGYFTGTAAFGSFNLTASGVSDIFVAKTNSSGVYQWAVKAGDGGSDRGLAIKSDASGNSYVTGYYYGTAHFGALSITSAGLQDVFVAKYDPNGNVLWVVSAGGTESDIGNAITIDNSGNVIVAGQFTGTATFGTFTLTSTSNNINVFTTKLNGTNGSFIWAKSGIGPHTDRGLGVACDPSGNVYITGQFTDTITFDTPYKSSLYNAIFVVKYNSSGVEQWITTAGAATSNIANAIAVDNNSNVYITGNFTGTLTFFANNATLTNTYANRIFLAKYNQSGSLLWDVADGSSNPVNSNDIALDASGNPYIIGNFDCIMNGYADRYGQGTFNTVGYWDIFNAEYSSSSGAWQWSRQIGGHGNNYGYGIAISPGASVCDAGSFDQDMIIATDPPPNFLGYNTTPGGCNPPYCSDAYYGDFEYFNTTGALDIFIAEPINLNRQTYDYYTRTGAGCSRPFVKVCIGTANVCEDTVQFCISGTIKAIPNTCTPIGPNYTYLWSTGARTPSINVSTTGWYSVTQTSVDGCLTSKDSIYVIIHPAPAKPCLSDNVVINTNSTNPLPIRVCEHSVILTGCDFSGDSTWYWTTPTNMRIDSTKITVTLHSDSGYYCFNVVSKYGCTSQTCVWVAIDSALPKIIPKITCLTCRHDTAFLCKGNGFTLFPYDSITNSSANPALCIPPIAATTNKWFLKPDTSASYSAETHCPDQNTFVPHDWDSGWFNITDTILQSNVCGKKKYVVKDSVYVRLYPVPIVTLSIKGHSTVCPGDSEWIVASANAPYTWSNGSTKDSIYVGPGSYFITATVTNSYGCSTTGTAFINIATYTDTIPKITMNPSSGVICPGDSVLLTCTGARYQGYIWYGPSGPMPTHTSTLYVTVPGSYYCVASDSTPCPFSALSNTVLVESYATPFLQLPASHNLCPGDSIILSVVASNDAVIQWLPPLSGNSPTQTITSPGTYSVQVTSCGITTVCSVTITESHPFAIITATPSKTLCNVGDSIQLSAKSGMANYVWTPGSINSQNIYVKSAATYTLTATDSYGCTATSDIVISPPVADSIEKATNISCMGSSSGVITLWVGGGATPYTYSWSPPEGNSPTASNLSAGSYTVTVTDANGCAKSASITLTQPPTLLVSGILSFSNVNCFGNLTGAATATASGGEPSYSYLWSPGGETTLAATGLGAGTYTVTVTDSAGCSKTSSVTITQPMAIVPTITPKEATCLDDDGAINMSVSGGVSPYTYLWNPGANTNTSLTGLTPGSYSVTITDANGCVDTSSVAVGIDTSLTIIITSGGDSICKGQSITLSVSGATTYLWSTGSTSTSITLAPPNTTLIWVKATTGICTDSVPYRIDIYPPLLAAMPMKDSICPGTSVTLRVEVAGGKRAYTYIWNDGKTTDPITVYPTADTTYSVSVTDACNYSATASMNIILLPKGTVDFSIVNDSIQAGQVVHFTNGSQDITNYYWNFGDGSTSTEEDPSHTYLNYGTYQITLIGYASDGCPDSATKDIYLTPEIYIPNVFTPNGDGINDVFYFTIQGTQCFHCDIYNRWGVLVYILNSEAQGWPGIIRQTNELASDGTYYYILNYCDYHNVQHNLDGFITLIRSK